MKDQADHQVNSNNYDNAEEPPPVGKSWNNLYLLVILVLVVQILIYLGITNLFA